MYYYRIPDDLTIKVPKIEDNSAKRQIKPNIFNLIIDAAVIEKKDYFNK